MNKTIVYNELMKQISNSADIVVIGLSGGADSTLVATLCSDALGKKNVYGLSLPCGKLDEQTFNERSFRFAEFLGIHHEYISISNVVDAFANSFDGLSPLNLGNVKSRTRMMFLYSQAGKLAEKNKGKRVRVVGTGNLSEDWIGYDTKGGDALADFFPIGELLKSEVYEMLEFVGVLEKFIDRAPSAGLEDGQTDEKDLGYYYDEMSKSVLYQFYNIKNETEVDKFVAKRHAANKHKHEAIPVFKLRNIIDAVEKG